MQKNNLTVRYIRLLSYENACKLIDFVSQFDKGKIDDDFAYITVGGVGVQTRDETWAKTLDFLNGLNVRYEVGTTPCHEVEKQIVKDLKQKGIINV